MLPCTGLPCGGEDGDETVGGAPLNELLQGDTRKGDEVDEVEDQAEGGSEAPLWR